MKIATIVGARPQFIKAAMVTRALLLRPHVMELLIHTGQHYDTNMSQVFLDQLRLPKPAYLLEIGSAGHGSQTGRMMEAIERVLLDDRPDWVVVYGDTNSTLAGALAACKLHIPVAHVEAGLRSFNRHMPEEINRIVADQVSDLLLVPTTTALENLRKEGINSSRVRLVGDVMFDAALHFAERAAHNGDFLVSLGLKRGDYILLTLHRAENTDDARRLRSVMEAIKQVGKSNTVVFPVHPRTRKALSHIRPELPNKCTLRLLDPVDYLQMILLEKNARLIATDSGGVQKEAFFFRVPCVTLRDETEWSELVQMGWNRLASPAEGPDAIIAAMESALNNVPTNVESPYGNGNAAEAIVNCLLERNQKVCCHIA